MTTRTMRRSTMPPRKWQALGTSSRPASVEGNRRRERTHANERSVVEADPASRRRRHREFERLPDVRQIDYITRASMRLRIRLMGLESRRNDWVGAHTRTCHAKSVTR